MENTVSTITEPEKKIAIIGYCFLAALILLSKKEEFSSVFVRKHARYALILHILFILTLYVFFTIPVTILGIPLMGNVLFYSLFFSLFFFLGKGMYKVVKGENPEIHIENFFSKKNQENNQNLSLTENEKKMFVLAHIPYVGAYISAKFGSKTVSGEKFGNWLVVILALTLVIDPHGILCIIVSACAIFWCIYQYIGITESSTLHPLGDLLWGKKELHTFLLHITQTTKEICRKNTLEQLNLGLTLSVQKTYTEIGNKYLFIPIVNIYFIIRMRKLGIQRHSLIQGSLLTLLFVISLYAGSIFLFMLMILAAVWAFFQSHFQKSTYIPLIGEIADVLSSLLDFIHKKSLKQGESFTLK